MKYVKRSTIPLKGHPELNEKWLQDRIVDDPMILGFGDFVVRQVEKTLPRGGRLDILLKDPETAVGYEVELRLGATDESRMRVPG